MITRALDLAWHVLAVGVTAYLERIESKPLPEAVQ
jgi:hypothetical protein